MKNKNKEKKCKGAIIIVDMIEAFYRGSLANSRVDFIVEPIRNLIRRKMEEGYKIIFLGDRHEPGDREFLLFGEHAVTSEDRKVIRELQEFLKDSIFVSKDTYSGFVNTGLEDVLVDIDPEEVIIAGVCTDICVFITASDLWRLGYKIVVARDTVETYDAIAMGHKAELINNIFIAQIRSIFGAKVVDSQEEL